MTKKLPLIILILSIYSGVKAQEHFITYNNDLERSLLKSANSTSDLVKLALAADENENDSQNIINKLDNDIMQLSKETDNNQTPENRLKKIAQTLHLVFLKKYDNDASFSGIFSTGKYQCIGASILYAYVLEQCHIPYQIKESPTHTYLVAYPDTYNITLETIDDKNGYFAPDEKSKQNYVNGLVKYNYLEDNYVKRVGTEQAFNDFFYGKPNITLKDAVGLLYYNKAIEYIQVEKTNQAYSNIEKAEILSPVKRNEFLKKLVLADLLQTLKFNDLWDWEAVTYAVNNMGLSEEAKKYMQFQFNELLQNKLWKEGQKEKVDVVYNYLHLNLKDSTLRGDIDEDYFYENGRYDVVSNKYPEALGYLDKAMIKSPNNPLIKSMIVDIIVQKMMEQTGSVGNVKLLDQYAIQFSFMATDPLIRSAYLYNYSYLAYAAFVREDKATGEKYMQLMVNELNTPKTGMIKNELQMASVFGKASEFYYRKQGRQKALQILNNGLKYFPDNAELLRKVKVILDSGK